MSKEHDQGFVEAEGGGECGLPLISFLDSDIIIPPSNIHLRKVFGSFQLIDEGRDEGKGVGILDRMFIEVSIVLEGL